jgi:hypothetical protein
MPAGRWFSQVFPSWIEPLLSPALGLALLAGGGLITLTGCGGGGSTGSGSTTQTAPINVSITPGSSVLTTGATLPLTVSLVGTTNSAVVWAVNGTLQGNAEVGTITGTGANVIYKAPVSEGVYSVSASLASDPSASAATVVTVQAPVVVTVNPTSVSLNTGSTIAITAGVTGSTNTAVAWAVDGIAGGNATVGSVAGSGNTASYTAPAAAGSHTVTATSLAYTSKSATTAVSVLASGVVVGMNPAAASPVPGGAVAITATVSGATNTAVAWTVDGVTNGNATVGTLSGTGNAVTYTAPATTGSHQVVATSVADSAMSATCAITVQATAPAVTMTMTPSAATTINGSGSGLFSATVSGSSNTAVTWSVDGVAGGNATVGTIKAGAAMGGASNHGNQVLYLAPAAAGSHTLTATSSVSPAVSVSVPVTVAATAYTVTKPGSIFNVTSYGAVADGVRDNGTAFANAIAAASANGGGVVVVPAAASPYEIACNRTGFGYFGMLVTSNVTLQINAGATVQAMAGAPSNCLLVAVSGTNVNIVGGGALDGNLPSNAGKELELIGLGIGSNITVANLALRNSPEDGIYIQQSQGYTLSGVQVYGVTTTGTTRDGLTVDSGSNIVIRDSTFSNSLSCGIDIEPNNAQNPTNVSIVNCQFSGNVNMNIQSGPDDTGDTGTFTNSVFAFNTLTGANIGIYQANSNGIAILNNTISGNVQGSYPACGIMLNDSGSSLGDTNDQVLGNSISGSAANGIYAINCHTTTVGYNTITGCAGYAIDNQDASITVESGTNTGSANARGNTNGSAF